jgi:CheY-like chemotaxis protein
VDLDEEQARTLAEVEPGRYASLTVRDTGEGIDQETLSHIFDPFFTTKEKGVGTGLGLSTVYGVVKQHQGHIVVDSEPGRGTSFKVYLPRLSEAPPVIDGAPTDQRPLEGHETVLIVEDERVVRNLACDGLEALGYHVLPAGSPEEAIEVSGQHQDPIQLLLTDVVLPRMDGRTLFGRLSSTRPDMKVLFVSGYTEEFIVDRGMLDRGVHFLQKPFNVDGLACKVREVLEEF